MRQLTACLLAFVPVLSSFGQSSAPRPHFDSFEVATIKVVDSTPTSGRFIKMQSAHRFIGKDYTLKLLLAAAYDLNPKTVTGGPSWIDSVHFDIQAITPGNTQPTHDEQMAMLRGLLDDRFKVAYHRESKEYSIYALEIAKSGLKMKAGLEPPESTSVLGPAIVYPLRIVLPARNVTTGDLASLLQRAILDRPVVDRTGLTARFDFDLEWAPDETQFGGDVPAASATAPSLPLFQAIERQLGLRLRATKGQVAALVVDHAEQPSAD